MPLIIDADGLNIAIGSDLTGFYTENLDPDPSSGRDGAIDRENGTGDPGRSAILWCAVQQRQRRDLCVKGCGNCGDLGADGQCY